MELLNMVKSLFDTQFHDEIQSVLQTGEALIALDCSGIVGFALLYKRTPLGLQRGFYDKTNYIEIAFLGVIPEKQGCGIGSGLLQYVKDLGYNVWLQVLYTNPDAKRLYERHGFTIWRTFGKKSDGGYVMGWSKQRHERLLRLR